MITDAKYLAASGNLLNTLKLKNLDMTPPKPETAADADMYTTCPAESDGSTPSDKEAMFNQALEKDRLNRAPAVEVLTPKQIIMTEKPVVIVGANFDYKSAVLKPAAEAALVPVVEFAQKYPEANMDVVGHTDNIGGQAYNLGLSKQRAESVKSWLVAHGINADRISAKGVGKTQPIAGNDTEEGRDKNRRVEIHYTVREEK